jgi:hypothetical protein
VIPEEPTREDIDELLSGLALCPECGGSGSVCAELDNFLGAEVDTVCCDTCGGGFVKFFWKDDIYYLLGYSYVYFCVLYLHQADSEAVREGSSIHPEAHPAAGSQGPVSVRQSFAPACH